ncbi:unnamed protein product [Brachionus calyciflorus]|uniref:G-protein coupled receptors family 1 profile domain-containing protein n=1 Tax=Brachionus calyciflorus TaxID=104777 RepID=A0A813N550_9BILA|nr:unnamed protein product [Brachionus calyciflorus]
MNLDPSNVFIEFINYIYVLPSISLFGLCTNFICVLVFFKLKNRENLHKYLLLNSIFNTIIFSLNILFTIIALVTKGQIIGSKEEALLELYVKNVFISFLILCSILFMIVTLLERYMNIKRINYSKNYFISILVIIGIGIVCFLPILIEYKIDSNYNETNFYFINTENYFSIKQIHKLYFRIPFSIKKKSTIFSLERRNLMNEKFYKVLMSIINFLIDILLILVPIIGTNILIFTLRDITNKKRNKFFCRAENLNMIRNDRQWLNFINLENLPSNQNSSDDFIVYRKSKCDIEREKLILMVIVTNLLLVIARIPNFVYLIYVTCAQNFSTVYLQNKYFIYIINNSKLCKQNDPTSSAKLMEFIWDNITRDNKKCKNFRSKNAA